MMLFWLIVMFGEPDCCSMVGDMVVVKKREPGVVGSTYMLIKVRVSSIRPFQVAVINHQGSPAHSNDTY